MTNRKCAICGQEGGFFLRTNDDGEVESVANPLEYYAPAAATVCYDCQHEQRDDLVGAVYDAGSLWHDLEEAGPSRFHPMEETMIF